MEDIISFLISIRQQAFGHLDHFHSVLWTNTIRQFGSIIQLNSQLRPMNISRIVLVVGLPLTIVLTDSGYTTIAVRYYQARRGALPSRSITPTRSRAKSSNRTDAFMSVVSFAFMLSSLPAHKRYFQLILDFSHQPLGNFLTNVL